MSLSRQALSLVALILFPLIAQGGEEKRVFKSPDGFLLNGVISSPDGTTDQSAKQVILIIHGSGPQNMDGDLSAASKGGMRNLVYKDLADALVKGGFVVIRYNKRGYELQQKVLADRAYARSKQFVEAMKHPLGDIIGDARAIARYANQRYKQARIYLLGHSQGTFVALQIAHRQTFIKGVALIGTMGASLATLAFEQIVYRSLIECRKLDRNQDGLLDRTELGGADTTSRALLQQLSMLDTDKDGKLGTDEIKAANFASYSKMLSSPVLRKMAQEEAALPAVIEILAKSSFKTAFFQGEWDNQTPAYQVRAFELLNKFQWKNSNLRFWYFSQLGHALDPRERYEQLLYSRISPKALDRLVEGLGQHFGK